MNDISIEQINLLLKEKENKIGVMESTTKSSREKLKNKYKIKNSRKGIIKYSLYDTTRRSKFT